MSNFQKCEWPYDSNPETLAQFDCYSGTFQGTVYLRVYHNVYEGVRSDAPIDLRRTFRYEYTYKGKYSGTLYSQDNDLAPEQAFEEVKRHISFIDRLDHALPVLRNRFLDAAHDERAAFDAHVQHINKLIANKCEIPTGTYAKLGTLFNALEFAERAAWKEYKKAVDKASKRN